MAYNDPVLQEIKERLNIADVISGYIQVKKSGANFKAICPFHNEKTPSLQISPQKQIWHCFGCGEGGDAFGFVMRYENVEFKDALKILAQKAGVVLPEYRPQDPKLQSEKELLLRINDFASRYYHKLILSDARGQNAKAYLESRGLNVQTIIKWQIGFAPESFSELTSALKKKNVSEADMVKAGVCGKNDRGQIYDRFRGRITFPIFDQDGNAVGFSARILNDDGKSAKYVNSPETLIYQKSKVLFGFNFAKNSIRKTDEAIFVEGQMDCITAHQAGFENVLATSGTALTEDQLSIISRLTKNLKYCFDSDQAGITASLRAGELAIKKGLGLKIISLKQAKDPDELIKKSPGLWEKAVKEAQWFLDWQMDYVKSAFSDPIEQKRYLSENVVPFLSYITDPLEQEHYVKKLSEGFNIFEKVIRDQIKNIKQPAGQKNSALEPGNLKPNVLEKEILGGMLVFEDFLGEVLAQTEDAEFLDSNIRQAASLLRSGELLRAKGLPVAKEGQFMVESQGETLDRDQQLRALKKTFCLFKVNSLKRQQQALTASIKSAEQTGNKILAQSLSRQFAELSGQRLKFEKQA